MDFKQGLFQQQSLKLTMTQELSQAIALLQYSTQELTAFLENKALENPLIQMDSIVVPVNPLADRNKKRNNMSNIENNWLEQICDNTQTIAEHLTSQLPLTKQAELLMPIIEILITYIDENGYLSLSFHDLQRHTRCTISQYEKSLSILQNMEPAGIAARNLQECILLQIKRMPILHPLAERLVEHHFEAFAEKKWKEIAKILEVNLVDIQEAFDCIQKLNPRPGATFKQESTSFIVPDVIVIWDGREYTITVFDEQLPKISFNEKYYQKYSKSSDKQVSKYMEHQQNQYHWLVKSLEQRKETLQKVALKIVEKQPEFFKNGRSNLKPMTMKEVADEIEVHESTVSRAVREKFVQTPFGVFELKSFFTSTIQTTSDESTSSTQVKEAIKKLIEAENKQKPLSDQDIVEILKDKNGIVLSRRTVAKYRDQLGIVSSSKRKRYE